MFALKDKYPDWKDFPNGLRVLVVDEDAKVLSEIKCKLEGCRYVVSAFTKGGDALAALRDAPSSFHLALVEAMNGDVYKKILHAARHLPIILMCNTENMSIMMQGIALGAADFLQKPLSDEKLRNIWQHVLRKAVAGDPVLMESFLPAKASESVYSVGEKSSVIVKIEPAGSADPVKNCEAERSGEASEPATILPPAGADAVAGVPVCEHKLPAPSTPQLEQVERTSGQEDSSSTESPGNSDSCLQVKAEGEDLEPDAAAVVVNVNSDGRRSANATLEKPPESAPCEGDDLQIQFEDDPAVIKLELLDDSLDDIGLNHGIVLDGDCGPGAGNIHPCLLVPLPDSDMDMNMNIEALDAGEVHDTEIGEEEARLLAEVERVGDESLQRTNSLNCPSVDSEDRNSGDKKNEQTQSDPGVKANKASSRSRKMKVDWTPELHRRFIQAVEQLGVEKAIPSRILELMNVQCLTRHNIASHLQKYRSHRRHLQAREAEAATWHHRKPLDTVWARTRRDGAAWLGPHHTNPPPIQPRPPVGLTPIQPHPGPHCHPMGHPMHVWGHPTMDHAAAHMWQPSPMAGPATWQAPDGSHWQYPCVDAWGHPAPAPGTPCYPHPYRMFSPMPPIPSPLTTAALAADCYFADESMPVPMYPTASEDPELTVAAGAAANSKPSDPLPPKEILDAAISEALANPFMPLPLGLKPPSMDGVMAELLRQGINTVPS